MHRRAIGSYHRHSAASKYTKFSWASVLPQARGKPILWTIDVRAIGGRVNTGSLQGLPPAIAIDGGHSRGCQPRTVPWTEEGP